MLDLTIHHLVVMHKVVIVVTKPDRSERIVRFKPLPSASVPTIGYSFDMRLTIFEKETILKVIHSQFGDEVKIWLFGSRVSDQKRGGDIDIFIETPQNFSEAWKHKMIAVSLLQIQLGDQKIDVIVRSADDADRPIYQNGTPEGRYNFTRILL